MTTTLWGKSHANVRKILTEIITWITPPPPESTGRYWFQGIGDVITDMDAKLKEIYASVLDMDEEMKSVCGDAGLYCSLYDTFAHGLYLDHHNCLLDLLFCCCQGGSLSRT